MGKWEGGTESGGTIVAARVEVLPGGGVKVSAPDVTYVTGNREQIEELRARLSAEPDQRLERSDAAQLRL